MGPLASNQSSTRNSILGLLSPKKGRKERKKERKRERKEGREEGRKKERKERKEGRKEGRKERREKFILSQSWRPEVQNQGVCRVGPFWRL